MAPPAPAPAPREEPIRVALVDDDPFAGEMLEAILVDGGHRVARFGDPAKALEGMTRDPPDVLLTDWFMTGMDGPQLIARVREVPALRGTYCILVTGRDAEGQKASGLEGGADDYLVKDGSPGELLSRVRVGARVRRLEREASILAMAAALGHEINNPLTAVLGFLEICEEHLKEGNLEELGRCLGKVRTSSERIEAIVRRLIELKAPRMKRYQEGTLMVDLGPPDPPRDD